MVKKHSAKTEEGLNPFIAILGTMIITVVMVTVTTIVFLRSGAYATVKQIQLGIQATELVDQGDLDITSPINAADIDEYATSLSQRLNAIDNDKDFGPEAVSDAALGL